MLFFVMNKYEMLAKTTVTAILKIIAPTVLASYIPPALIWNFNPIKAAINNMIEMTNGKGVHCFRFRNP